MLKKYQKIKKKKHTTLKKMHQYHKTFLFSHLFLWNINTENKSQKTSPKNSSLNTYMH